MKEPFELQQQDKQVGQFLAQQQMLISVLKQQILRLQQDLHTQYHEKEELQHQLLQMTLTISQLKDKITNITENNESLLRTVQVFQSEFIRREGRPLGKLPLQVNGTGPFHIEIIRNLKSKINNTIVEPQDKAAEKSQFAQYYGFFLQDQTVEEMQVNLFNQIVQNKPVRVSKVRSLGKKSYFHQKFRHVFWSNSIQNKLNITQRLYLTLRDTYQQNMQNKPPKSSIIDLDLRRMDLKLDEDKSRKVSLQIKRLLEIFQLYRPDIKYVQGMSYLAWIFLIRMTPFRSFVAFTNLILCDPFVYALYSFDQLKIKKILEYFGLCLAQRRPKLHRHMITLGVDADLFLIEWAYTLFSRAFSLRIVSKIWDLWFSQGYGAFFKVAMAVLEMLEGELMGKNQNDKFIDTVRTYSFKLEETQFLRVLGKQKLLSQELKLQ